MKQYTYFILTVLYAVGVAGHIYTGTRDLMLLLTPFTLFLTGAITIYGSEYLREQKFILWFAATYVFTFFLEWLGVITGMIFGTYHYTDVLGLSIGGVPLIIGWNWVLVIAGSITLAGRYLNNIYVVSLTGGILAVVFDLFLEPVAITLNYWVWPFDTVPLQNYTAWFLISFSAVLLYKKTVQKNPPDIFAFYFLLQLGFFICLNLFL